MPKGTKVHDMYEAMKREGMSKGKAARIAQAKTGMSLMTGKPPMEPMMKPKQMMMKSSPHTQTGAALDMIRRKGR